MTREEAEKHLAEVGKTLTENSFNRAIAIQHVDGSHFFFANATLDYVMPWYFVWTERTGHHFFRCEDIQLRSFSRF